MTSRVRAFPARLIATFAAAAAFACGASNPDGVAPWGDAAPPANGDSGTGKPPLDGGATQPETGGGGAETGGGEPDTGGVGPIDTGAPNGGDDGPPSIDAPPGDDAGEPPGFWDASNIPPAKNVMIFKFLNRTNGKFADSEVYWSFKSGTTTELHSIADQPTYDMPANNSGRMYFYLCAAGAPTNCTGDPTKSLYYDFIEHTIGPAQYNGNTTRVDAFGLKIAMHLHCADGYDVAVGEDYETFLEDRAVTFQKFLNEVPPEFQPLAQPPHAPYRIVEPGGAGFGATGMYATYYDSFVNQLWANNGLTIPKPGPNGSGLGAYPNISAAIFRHVGDTAGTFMPDGKLANNLLWTDSSSFYQAAPANYYARFWHTHGLNGKAYGFPYDDVGGYSSYISHANPQYMLVAIGW